VEDEKMYLMYENILNQYMDEHDCSKEQAVKETYYKWR